MYLKPTRVCRRCKRDLPKSQFDLVEYNGKRDRRQYCHSCRVAHQTRMAQKPISKGNGTLSIPLTQGKFALIDEEDWPLIRKLKWHAATNGETTYAIHSVKGGKLIQMHRVILPPPAGMEVDHLDGNGLNNRRDNLRLCTRSQNQMNTRKKPNTTSGYKGVYFFRATEKWHARITLNGRRRHLGFFHSEEAAARAYDAAARETFGEFARLNFPNKDEQGCTGD